MTAVAAMLALDSAPDLLVTVGWPREPGPSADRAVLQTMIVGGPLPSAAGADDPRAFTVSFAGLDTSKARLRVRQRLQNDAVEIGMALVPIIRILLEHHLVARSP